MWSARPFNSDSPDPFGRNQSVGERPLSAESAKCPSCGSNIVFRPEVQGMVCRNCGNIYKPSTLEKIGSLGYSIEHDYSSDSEISDDDKKRHEIVCDSCGATMIADEHMMSTTCPFCGSPALVTRMMTREFKPDYIIPFKIDRPTAEKNMKQWIKTRKMTQAGFKSKSRVTKMMAFYVPFWIVDCGVHSDMIGTGTNLGGSSAQVNHVTSKASYFVKGVPFDASMRIANKLMEAIEPFDYSEMVPFHNRYLQGFCAEKYDQGPIEIMDRFIKRFDRFSVELHEKVAKKYDKYVPDREKTFTWMSELNIKYCLLPVWFMTVEFDSRQYQFAVNGQTGEASGQAPTTEALDVFYSIARFTRSKLMAIPIALAVIIPALIFLITMSMNTGPFFMTLFIILAIIEVILLAGIILMYAVRGVATVGSKKIREKADASNDFDKDPGLERYLDTTRRTDLKVHAVPKRVRSYYLDGKEDKDDDWPEIDFEVY